MKKHTPSPKPVEPIDSEFVSLATKIVERSTIGRRWYFHNRTCVAFFHAPETHAIVERTDMKEDDV